MFQNFIFFEMILNEYPSFSYASITLRIQVTKNVLETVLSPYIP